MKKMGRMLVEAVLVLAVLSLVLCTAGAYELPEGNLVIIEVDSVGGQLEKKIAENADLLFTREMRNAALLDLNGIRGYQATFTLNVKNVSGGRLENVSLIEVIPKEVAASAALIRSDSQFVVLEDDPVVKFSLGTIEEEGTASASYRVEFGDENKEIVAEAFKEMGAPVALIPIGKNDCTGITCNDFNPCTNDYCSERECVYGSVADGSLCGEGMSCTQGSCQKFKSPDLLIAAGVVIIVIVLLSVALIYKARKKGGRHYGKV